MEGLGGEQIWGSGCASLKESIKNYVLEKSGGTKNHTIQASQDFVKKKKSVS